MIALNPDVRKALFDDICLFLLWKKTHANLDSDLDPFHNPDWVNMRKQKEADSLALLKEQLSEFCTEWLHMEKE